MPSHPPQAPALSPQPLPGYQPDAGLAGAAHLRCHPLRQSPLRDHDCDVEPGRVRRSRPASSPVWPGTPIVALATLAWTLYSPAETATRTLPGVVAGHVPVQLRNPMTAPARRPSGRRWSPGPKVTAQYVLMRLGGCRRRVPASMPRLVRLAPTLRAGGNAPGASPVEGSCRAWPPAPGLMSSGRCCVGAERDQEYERVGRNAVMGAAEPGRQLQSLVDDRVINVCRSISTAPAKDLVTSIRTTRPGTAAATAGAGRGRILGNCGRLKADGEAARY